jgi:hypothetical protein
MIIRHALPLALVLLAGCARSEEASFTPADNSGQSVERVRTPDTDEEELSLGQWRAGLQDEQATLEFGPTGAPALLSLGCDSRRGTLVQRLGAAPSGDLPVMLITVGSETRRLALASTGGAIPMLRATLAPTDPFRAVLTNAASPIIIRIGDSPPLVLPPSPLIGAYTTGCANGENQRRADVEVVGNATAPANDVAPSAD